MRTVLAAFSALVLSASIASAAEPDVSKWSEVLADAKGETVYFNAWGGGENINAYLGWAGEEVARRYGVKLVHVKLDDTAKAVGAVVAEKAAGKIENGSVDMIWINGENFASMKTQGLLMSPGWADKLPNWQYVNPQKTPTIVTDFTIPTDGLESPWGMAKLVFFYDSARSKAEDLPRSADALLDWAKAHPGRFTYPQPPDFTGSTFLKQILAEKIADKSILQKPVDGANFADATRPLFDYLDQLNPLLWRQGKAFPPNYPALKQLLADSEIDISFAFNPSEASSAIAAGELPDTVRSFVFTNGTIANSHFVTIPFNATAKAGALVVADFLLSPEAQARKQDPKVWGDPTVLDVTKLPEVDAARFKAIDAGIATLGPAELGPAIDEPHPSWMERIEAEWTKRYGAS